MDAPPINTTDRIFDFKLKSIRICASTCMANSRVGVTISPRTSALFMTFVSKGIEKAAVLPVPVCAEPRISLPLNAIGIALCWMAVGVLNLSTSNLC